MGNGLGRITEIFGNFVFPVGLSIFLIVRINEQLTTQNMSLLRMNITLDRICRRFGLNGTDPEADGAEPSIEKIKRRIKG